LRVVGDPREPLPQLDDGRQLALLVESVTDRHGIRFGHDEHRRTMGHAPRGRQAQSRHRRAVWPGRVRRERPGNEAAYLLAFRNVFGKYLPVLVCLARGASTVLGPVPAPARPRPPLATARLLCFHSP